MDVFDSLANLCIPDELSYTKEHFWVYREDKRRFSIVGPTEVIARRLNFVYQVDLYEGIAKTRRGQIVGRISGQDAFDNRHVTIPIISPLSGVVNPVNEMFKKQFVRRSRPELIINDPYGDGWIMAILGESESDFNYLLNALEYRNYLRQKVTDDSTFLYRHEESLLSELNPTQFDNIFISYRRDDTGRWAKKLAERLEQYYGGLGLYLDIYNNRPGEDYRSAIEACLKKVNVVVVIIGPEFFRLRNKNGVVRLLDDNDTVRAEIRLALESGKIVCPLLVDGAVHPTLELLPEDIQELHYRQSFDAYSEDMLEVFVASLRPELVGENKVGISKPGEHAVLGIEKTYRDNQSDYVHAITTATVQLVEFGWCFDSRKGDGCMTHPGFPQYRIRFNQKDGVAWLDTYVSRRWRRDTWSPAAAFPLTAVSGQKRLSSLPKDLALAAANPDAFLDSRSHLS